MACGCALCAAGRDGDKAQDQLAPSTTFEAIAIFDPKPVAAGTDGFTAGAATAPAYAISALINEYGYQWGTSSGATVTYSFLSSVPSYYSSNAEERTNFASMNSTQRQAARDAFAFFAEVANITFVEATPGKSYARKLVTA